MSIARHTTFNFVALVVPIAVSIVTVPLYLKVIGLDRYGVLSICWVLVGYFGLFDLGIGRATAQKIATLGNSSPEERSRCFWAGATLSIGLAVIGLLLFTPLAYAGIALIKLPNMELYSELRRALPLLMVALPFGLMQSLLSDTLQGRSEFFKRSAINVFGTVITAVVPLITAVLIGPQLDNLIAAVLVTRVIVTALLIGVCVRAVPIHRFRFARRTDVVQLVRFGSWVTITNIVGPLLVFTDRFVIGAILGSAAVAIYTVPYNMAWQLTVIPSSLSSALFPRFASVDRSESKRLIRKAVAALSFSMTPACVAAVLLAPPFLVIWLGNSTGTKSAPIACILLFGLWANTFGRIADSDLQAKGRPDLTSKMLSAELPPYLVTLYFLLKWMGLPGAAVAWSLRCLFDTVGLLVLDRAPVPGLRRLVAQGVLILVAVLVSIETAPWSYQRLAAIAILLAVAVVLVWRDRPALFEQLARTHFRSQLSRIVKRPI